MPFLPSLVLPLRVQLQTGGTACWEATFSAPSVNTTAKFQARAD